MNIRQLEGVSGAQQAEGAVVIIDIIRAATVEAYAFGQGAEKIIAVSSKEEAFQLRRDNPGYLLLGEEHGIKVPGFDFGNSPSEISRVNLAGKTLVHRSTSGTQGLTHAKNAEVLIFGSFVTGSAVYNYIKAGGFNQVSIVSMDQEDIIFADALENLFKTGAFDREKVKKDLYKNPGVQWFFDSLKPEFPPEDIDYSLDFDRFNFFCLAQREEGRIIVRPRTI